MPIFLCILWYNINNMESSNKQTYKPKNTFDKVTAFARGYSGISATAPDGSLDSFSSLNKFGEDLKVGKEQLITSEVVGAKNLMKAVEQADHNTQSDRFSKSDENKAIQNSINQFTASYLSNKDSLRQASNQFFETAGDLMTNTDLAASVGENMWEMSPGNKKDKKKAMDDFTNDLVSNSDLFFKPGENEFKDQSGTTEQWDEWLDAFTPQEYKRQSRSPVEKVLSSFVEIPAGLAEGVIKGAWNMTAGVPINFIKLVSSDTPEERQKAALNLTSAAIDWGIMVATAGTGSLIVAGSEAATSEVATKAVEKSAKSITKKVASKEASEIITKDAASEISEKAFDNATRKMTGKVAKIDRAATEGKLLDVKSSSIMADLASTDLDKEITRAMKDTLGKEAYKKLDPDLVASIKSDLTNDIAKKSLEENKGKWFTDKVSATVQDNIATKTDKRILEETSTMEDRVYGRFSSQKISRTLNPFSKTYVNSAGKIVPRKSGAFRMTPGHSEGLFKGLLKGGYDMGMTDVIVRQIIGKPVVDTVTTSFDEGLGRGLEAGALGLADGILQQNAGDDWDLSGGYFDLGLQKDDNVLPPVDETSLDITDNKDELASEIAKFRMKF